MNKNTKLEEDFFDFVSERVLFVGDASNQETSEQSLEKINEQIKNLVGAEIWNDYQAQVSLQTDQMMLTAYKKGFLDALQLSYI